LATAEDCDADTPSDDSSGVLPHREEAEDLAGHAEARELHLGGTTVGHDLASSPHGGILLGTSWAPKLI